MVLNRAELRKEEKKLRNEFNRKMREKANKAAIKSYNEMEAIFRENDVDLEPKEFEEILEYCKILASDKAQRLNNEKDEEVKQNNKEKPISSYNEIVEQQKENNEEYGENSDDFGI